MKPKVKMKIFFIALKIFLCLILLVSTTLALFTDSEDVNIHVSSGEMEMDLLQANENGEYVSIKNTKSDVFGGEPWEPNQTRVVFFKIENHSNIRVKYSFRLNSVGDGMDGALEYCAFESEYFNTKGMNWAQITEMASPTLLQDGYNPLSGDSYIAMEPGQSHYYAVAVHMLSSSGNQYQNQICTVDVNVFAVQGNADLN